MLRTIAVFVVIGAIVILSQSVFQVTQGEQAVVLQLGEYVRTVKEPGLHAKYPLIQRALFFDKRVLAAEARPAEYITLDKKRLTVDTVSRWIIAEPLEFYQTVGDYRGAISRLNDIMVTRLRQEIANHNFKEFIREERERIMQQVTNSTRDYAKGFGINVIDVRIRRVDLPEEVQNSVFARMRAERERIAKRYRAEGEEQAREIRANAEKEKEILLAEAYRKSETLRGEGDAEATTIYAEAYNKDPEFFSFLRHLDAYKRVFGPETTLLLRGDSPFLRFLDAGGGTGSASALPTASEQRSERK
ncbi:MAG: protease modulator HflC [Desulfomonile tiedjei]|nr:protease modulator HflC [Desulfomonile tiedjei]